MTAEPPVRPPSVAGSFYPASVTGLEALVGALFEAAARLPGANAVAGSPAPLGLLVPHAGLVYSGVPAAAGWATLAAGGRGGHGERERPDPQGDEGAPIVVILGTNHRAAWLDGIAAWDRGAWSVPGGDVRVDAALAAGILALGPPFLADPAAHLGEHSIEVQLPLLAVASPGATIVPLAVAAGTGERAVEAGIRLGRLLEEQRAATGRSVVLAISTDMAHYPAADVCEAVTERLLPPIRSLDPAGLAGEEAGVRDGSLPGVVCGMCGIAPAVLGLAALRAMGARRVTTLAASTSADAGGPADRTVGYLAVRFDP